LRAYWKEYGGLSFDRRLMKVLTDPKANAEALREAAYNLGRLGEERRLGTTVFTDRGTGRPRGPNPAVAKFSNPTAAEAIRRAMARAPAAYDAGPRNSLHDYSRRPIEDVYLAALVGLGDRRIAPELARRGARAETGRMRRKWAFAGRALGDPAPLKAFARDFEAGTGARPPPDQARTAGQRPRARRRPPPGRPPPARVRPRPGRPGRPETPAPPPGGAAHHGRAAPHLGQRGGTIPPPVLPVRAAPAPR